eukprot:Amastigsp_a512484_49.p3 type:complete len:173 gc:universal Amastigsp_a512484_49:619-1137(+)
MDCPTRVVWNLPHAVSSSRTARADEPDTPGELPSFRASFSSSSSSLSNASRASETLRETPCATRDAPSLDVVSENFCAARDCETEPTADRAPEDTRPTASPAPIFSSFWRTISADCVVCARTVSAALWTIFVADDACVVRLSSSRLFLIFSSFSRSSLILSLSPRQKGFSVA